MSAAEHALIDRIRARVEQQLATEHTPRPIRYPPATPQTVAAAEARLGFALPPLLRALYLHVGNGGFGPGYGIVGIDGGHAVFDHTLVDLYHDWTHDDSAIVPWPAAYLPLCDWGCNMLSVLRWTHPDAAIFFFDGNEYDLDQPWETAMQLEAPSLAVWLEHWLSTEGS